MERPRVYVVVVIVASDKRATCPGVLVRTAQLDVGDMIVFGDPFVRARSDVALLRQREGVIQRA